MNGAFETPKERRDLVIVSNRLPVDAHVEADGRVLFTPSPGGLVAAVGPIARASRAAWIGWIGEPDIAPEPFEQDGVQLVPVPLSAADFEEYYEGFSNDTLWPLYHDVIVPPSYHRDWWDRYRQVNRRFAERAAQVAARGATVWVHDYQLQLVPGMLRALRDDLSIGYFHHVPFPPSGIFTQLPWRTQIVEGLLGADVIGFQRATDTANYLSAVRRLTTAATRQVARGATVTVARPGRAPHRALVATFPISIDIAEYERLAADPAIRARAGEIRAGLGDRTVILGVDRLDYTKGIAHRIKAFSELLEDGAVDVDEVVLIQVASPSRERVEAYKQLRDEVELMVGRTNGAFQTLEHPAISYHHRSYGKEEMVALYLAADIALVTPLRDGMNLVAKEYVASRIDGDGVLILSEFAGATDELRKAVIVNPHDIAAMKEAILASIRMPSAERRGRMRQLQRRLKANDVEHWASSFLDALEAARLGIVDLQTGEITLPMLDIPEQLDEALQAFARRPDVLIAVDFDGTIAPFTADPARARILPRARAALLALTRIPRTRVALVSGRSIESLARVSGLGEAAILVGSHGAEVRLDGRVRLPTPDASERMELDRVGAALRAVAVGHPGAWVERKPVGVAIHTRGLDPAEEADVREETQAAIAALHPNERALVREGDRILEFSLRGWTKGDAIEELRETLGSSEVFFVGDDLTDEDGFGALGPDDVSVKCGPGETLARFRVADPIEVARLLARLAELRAARVVDSAHARNP